MSKLFEGLERIEEAREQIKGASFLSGLFLGNPQFDLLLVPSEPSEEKAQGEAYCKQIETFLKNNVDADEIERNGKIPQHVLDGLLELGAFGMKIPVEYGGLGFSYTNYGRVLTLIASWSNILSLTVAVPQSIGIAMPIMLYGTEEQKKKYLPIVANKSISAFALTEPSTGSDAANVQTEAILSADGSHFVVNGNKQWCTNSPIADFITLIARVPAKKQKMDGKTVWIPAPEGKNADSEVHTAFILDMKSQGVKVNQRCQFEGCRGIENGYMTYTNVAIPIENVIGEIGAGLKYALSILNIGRAVSVPAICLGMAKQAWQPTLDRANSRVTFGKSLSERQTQQKRIGRMATSLFAMEAMCEQVWRMADYKQYDVRIEAAVTKIFCSEETIQFLDDAQVIFGGMGYETADSKRFRGEPAFGLEQLVRDATMYRIGEGATDILRPYVAREGLNTHLEKIQGFVENGLSFSELKKLTRFYLPWYLSQWKKKPIPSNPELQTHWVKERLTYIENISRTLARRIFYAMLIKREGMRDDQGRQDCIAMIGEELFAITTTVLHAQQQNTDITWQLANEFYRGSQKRIKNLLWALLHNDDKFSTTLGQNAVCGGYAVLNKGIIQRGLEDYRSERDDDF
ncbi:acyl-CoA dehydrogenase family protein [Pseudomonadota bacterium]